MLNELLLLFLTLLLVRHAGSFTSPMDTDTSIRVSSQKRSWRKSLSRQQATSTTTTTTQQEENPLWPNGVAADDIRELVDDIIADPSINIAGLPDVLERQIYKTTTILTYNAVYRLVGSVHNKALLGHTIEVTRLRRNKDRYNRAKQKSLLHMKTDVDEELLEDIADQLLSNTAINQPLIPDVIERQLYMNCLKIIFRILNMLAASFRITICGHDLTLNLNKAVDRNRDTILQVARTASSSKTPIDTTILQDLVRSHRYDEAAVFRDNNNNDDDDDVDIVEGDGTVREESDGGNMSIWKKGIRGTQEEFVVQVNTVLYSLILGIIDDLLANTELVLMTDRIHFDIIPPSSPSIKSKKKRRNSGIKEEVQSAETTPQHDIDPPLETKDLKRRQRLRMGITFLVGAIFGVATRSVF